MQRYRDVRWKIRKKRGRGTCLIGIEVCALRHASRLRDVCTPSWRRENAALYIFHGSTRLGALHAFFSQRERQVRGKSWPIRSEFRVYSFVPRHRNWTRRNGVFRFIDRDRLRRCGCLRASRTRSGKSVLIIVVVVVAAPLITLANPLLINSSSRTNLRSIVTKVLRR